jgi:endonuclease YncB( thermonuclease family)
MMRPSPLWIPAITIGVLLLTSPPDRGAGKPPAETHVSSPADSTTQPGNSSASVPAAGGSDTLTGKADVADGDTLQIGATRVRIHGIDAPEYDQGCLRGGKLWPCGEEAGKALERLIAGREVRCVQVERDDYHRIVAKCHVGEVDLGAALVAAGLAMAYRHYSQDYAALEERARSRKLGMWGGESIPPWDWRRNDRVPEKFRVHPRKPACRIKGNISRSGERIYHTPRSPWYDATHLDVAAGERWFCTEEEARAAGWRSFRNPPSDR